jgi:hypothetical protein
LSRRFLWYVVLELVLHIIFYLRCGLKCLDFYSYLLENFRNSYCSGAV